MGSICARCDRHEKNLTLFGFLFTFLCFLFVVIAKVFRQADTNETGSIDASLIPTLAGKILGPGIKENETQIIKFKTESREGMQRQLLAVYCMGSFL